MRMQGVSLQLRAIKGMRPFKSSVFRFTAIAVAAVAVTILIASSALAAGGGIRHEDGVHFFQGTKLCSQSTTPPLFSCVVTPSSGTFLRSATVVYFSVPATFTNPGRIDSDVRLTTADNKPSTAKGHCTFYFATGTGVCTYDGGTGGLAGFHAAFVIGPNLSPHTFSVIGKYLFGDRDN